MKAGRINIQRIFEETIRYEVPLYQLPYVWSEADNWRPLWEDVRVLAERQVRTGDSPPHFLGAIVLDQIRAQTGSIETRQVIDGQQRLICRYLSAHENGLVVTRLHECHFFALSNAEQLQIRRVVATPPGILEERLAPDGFNIGLNASAAAGQTVAHAGVRVISRCSEDAAAPRDGVRWIVPAGVGHWTDD